MIVFAVSNYLLGGEIQAREFVAPTEVKENGLADNYSFSEQRLQQVPESEHMLENNASEESNGLLQNTVNAVQDHLPPAVEEPVGEPQKHTYASIVCTKSTNYPYLRDPFIPGTDIFVCLTLFFGSYG